MAPSSVMLCNRSNDGCPRAGVSEVGVEDLGVRGDIPPNVHSGLDEILLFVPPPSPPPRMLHSSREISALSVYEVYDESSTSPDTSSVRLGKSLVNAFMIVLVLAGTGASREAASRPLCWPGGGIVCRWRS